MRQTVLLVRGIREIGGCMQSMSHDSASKRETAPKQWAGKPEGRPDVYAEQEDQWAVLRNEVEAESVKIPDERIRPGWNQRDTEEDSQPAQSPLDALERAQHHIDIVVAGVGGGGMNAVNRMISTHVRGVRFIAMNTDTQVLSLSDAQERISLGQHYTKGLGAGGISAVGMRAATESTAEIRAALGEADLVFIAAGMGGGTGTGAAPVIASIARKIGALTIGIVTLPFTFEGTRRRRIAEEGLEALSSEIDALITVPNDRLLATAGRERNLVDAFKLADDVLRQGVQGIAEVINVPGMINVDFADVRSVLHEAGTALMSIGQGQGRSRAQHAAEEAVAGGFLNVTIRGAKRVLFNISGGEDMTLFEVNEVAERIGQAIDDTADITFGAVIDPALKDTIRVTLIAAGMEERSTARIPAIHLNQPRQTPVHATPPVPVQSASERLVSPPSRPANHDVQQRPVSLTPPAVPAAQPTPPRSPGLSGRQQRMGRRQEPQNRQYMDKIEEGVDADAPPFLQ